MLGMTRSGGDLNQAAMFHGRLHSTLVLAFSVRPRGKAARLREIVLVVDIFVYSVSFITCQRLGAICA